MKKPKLTTETFIVRAAAVHNNKFTYENAVYVGWTKKITITCPVHGDFVQTAKDHLHNRGCNKCGRAHTAANQTHTKEIFILRAQKVHGSKFDYGQVVYVNAKTAVTIKCPTHGEFSQVPDTHLSSKYGCILCGHAATGKHSRSSTDKFVAAAKRKYGEKYVYDNSVYHTAISDITIACTRCGKEFVTSPNKHLTCGTCPYCDSRGFDKTKPGILYYLSINHGQAYKIGITNLSVDKRYSLKELSTIRIIKTWDFAIGQEAYDAEQYYIKEYAYAKYTGDPLLVTGNTELFNCDILLLDH